MNTSLLTKLVFYIGLCTLAAIMAGCGHTAEPAKTAPTTSEQIRNIQADANRTGAAIDRAVVTVDAATPASLPADKPVIKANLTEAKAGVNDTLKDAGEAGKLAAGDAKREADLQAKLDAANKVDFLQRMLEWIAGLAITAAVVMLVIAGIQRSTHTAAIGCALLAGGIGIGAIARRLHTLEDIALGVVAVVLLAAAGYAGWLAWHWWQKHKQAQAQAVEQAGALSDVVHQIDAAKEDTGVINPVKLEATLKSQSVATKRIVAAAKAGTNVAAVKAGKPVA